MQTPPRTSDSSIGAGHRLSKSLIARMGLDNLAAPQIADTCGLQPRVSIVIRSRQLNLSPPSGCRRLPRDARERRPVISVAIAHRGTESPAAVGPPTAAAGDSPFGWSHFQLILEAGIAGRSKGAPSGEKGVADLLTALRSGMEYRGGDHVSAHLSLLPPLQAIVSRDVDGWVLISIRRAENGGVLRPWVGRRAPWLAIQKICAPLGSTGGLEECFEVAACLV